MDRNIPARGALSGQSQLPPGHRALVRWTVKENGVLLPRLLPCSQRSRVVEVTTRPAPPRNLCPTPHKGALINKGTTILENPPRQRQRWGRQRQSPHHPRLWENHKRSLIGGPRKMGVQGVGDIGAGPAQPVLSLCAHPRCLFGFFLGTQKEARRRSGEILQTRHRRCQTLPA